MLNKTLTYVFIATLGTIENGSWFRLELIFILVP